MPRLVWRARGKSHFSICPPPVNLSFDFNKILFIRTVFTITKASTWALNAACCAGSAYAISLPGHLQSGSCIVLRALLFQ